MSQVPAWFVPVAGVLTSIILAMLTYLVNGLLSYGRTTSTLQEKMNTVEKATTQMEKDLGEVRKEMLRPADLKAAILDLQVQFYKDSEIDRRRREPRKT